MAKNIYLSEDVYQYLISIKGYNESFSKVIRRTIPISNQKELLSLAGSVDDPTFIAPKRNISVTNRNPI